MATKPTLSIILKAQKATKLTLVPYLAKSVPEDTTVLMDTIANMLLLLTAPLAKTVGTGIDT